MEIEGYQDVLEALGRGPHLWIASATQKILTIQVGQHPKRSVT